MDTPARSATSLIVTLDICRTVKRFSSLLNDYLRQSGLSIPKIEGHATLRTATELR
jgi:hypothetical protein